MVYQLHRSQQLSCSIETAWDFFSSPLNLSRITPGDMNFKMLSTAPVQNIFEGMVIDYRVSPVLGIPIKWQSLITEVNEQRSFTDVQLKGPYKIWRHFHEFIANPHGVLMIDRVEYELPLSIVGKFAHTFYIKRKLEQIFDYRHTACDGLFNLQTPAR